MRDKEFYLNSILSVKQSVYNGSPNMAKPLLILCIIECIDNRTLLDNRIILDSLCPVYERIQCRYKITRLGKIAYPFYYLVSESFYHLRWKEHYIKSTPSNKFLNENVNYAFLDDELWNILQNDAVRNEFKKAIEDKFFISRN